jgi:hypothetical protein
MTSDGITRSDWDTVGDYAARIANAVCSQPEQMAGARALTRDLLDYLDCLERSYGRLPSMLATRADYVSSTAERRGQLRDCG